MKVPRSLLALLLASAAVAQTTPPARPASARTGQAKEASRSGAALPPDPDLFDGSKFEAEKRPETGMIGEFEMPGGPEQSDKVGGDPGQAGGGNQPPPPNAAAGGAAGAASAAGGGAPASAAAGSEGAAGGGASAENAGAAGAVGGALDQSKPMGTGQSSGAGDPNAKAEGMQADGIQGASGGSAAAAQNAAGSSKSKAASGRIGSAELRIDALPPEAEKDVIGREAAPGGTQGSNKAMPAGKGGQGSNNQNKGVEKGKVIPKGL